MSESDLYAGELAKARAHLAEWERLGRERNKLNDPDWQLIRNLRTTQIEYLESLLKRIAQN